MSEIQDFVKGEPAQHELLFSFATSRRTFTATRFPPELFEGGPVDDQWLIQIWRKKAT